LEEFKASLLTPLRRKMEKEEAMRRYVEKQDALITNYGNLVEVKKTS